MKTINITIKGINYFFTAYLFRKIKMLKYRLQVMKNTADHYSNMISELNKTNNALKLEIQKLKDINLNSRKRRRNMYYFQKNNRYVVD